MNRQRTLLIVVGGIGAVLVGKAVVGFYTDALSSRAADIARLQHALSDIESQQTLAGINAREWRNIGAQTLSMDTNEAKRRLRDEVYDQMDLAHLSNQQVDLMTEMPFGKNGLKVLPCTATAEGDMQQMVQFLYSLYRRPYLVRIKELTLVQSSTSKTAVEGQLKITAKIETLILPPNGKVHSIDPVDLKKDQNKQVERTQFAKLDDYKLIVDRKMVQRFRPPMPGKATTPTPAHDAMDIDPNRVTLTWSAGSDTKRHQVFFGENSPSPSPIETVDAPQLIRNGLKPGVQYAWRVDETSDGGTTPGDVWTFHTKGQPTTTIAGPVVPPLPPPPQPPADANMILKRVLSSPIKQEAILVDAGQQANAAAAEKRVEVGEPFYGGVLVYVHPHGVISERDGVLRFHALESPLNAAQPLNEKDQPEIWYEIKKLEAQAMGISERSE